MSGFRSVQDEFDDLDRAVRDLGRSVIGIGVRVGRYQAQIEKRINRFFCFHEDTYASGQYADRPVMWTCRDCAENFIGPNVELPLWKRAYSVVPEPVRLLLAGFVVGCLLGVILIMLDILGVV